jgi:membrane protein
MEEAPVRSVLSAPAEGWFRRAFGPTLSYWMETEVHVYAFSIAANVLLSFFPFLIVILSVCRHLLGWHGADNVIAVVLTDFFSGDTNNRDTLGNFMYRNLTEHVGSRGALPIASVFLLLFAANGIFEPLEVALNRAWGITKNRSYLMNQLISFGLILVCGSLALASTAFTGINLMRVGTTFPKFPFVGVILFKMAALPVSILILFLVYWKLPNARVDWRAVLPAAILVGIALEILKNINLLTWRLWQWKLEPEYGPFYRSATIILWSFFGAMIILAGAEWSARTGRKSVGAEVPIASRDI